MNRIGGGTEAGGRSGSRRARSRRGIAETRKGGGAERSSEENEYEYENETDAEGEAGRREGGGGVLGRIVGIKRIGGGGGSYFGDLSLSSFS